MASTSSARICVTAISQMGPALVNVSRSIGAHLSVLGSWAAVSETIRIAARSRDWAIFTWTEMMMEEQHYGKKGWKVINQRGVFTVEKVVANSGHREQTTADY